MKSRTFPNWLDAYLAYAQDGFVPENFNLWSGLSVIAGSLERKVWLPWSDTFSYYPNIFVLMVSLPGVGKSTALNKALGLMQEMNARQSKLNIIPSQVTEAKFIELMGNGINFELGTQIILMNAGFYWASEASNSLKNVYGDFIACLTDFYDCPPFWEKATKKDDKITLKNVCLNLLAGSTFDYLSKLVTDDNIMGGFASRLIYVVHRDKLVREQAFQLGGSQEVDPARVEYRRALVDDMVQIHEMVGPFRADREFGKAWEEWYPKFEKERQEHPSEKMQSLLVRTNTNVLKCAMLCSAARSNERILTIEDWDRAQTIIEPIASDLPGIFRESKANDTKSQQGLNNAIIKELSDASLVLMDYELENRLIMRGFEPNRIKVTVKSMTDGRVIGQLAASGAGIKLKLLVDPNTTF